MWMQKFTTKEPDDSMIEVGIKAVEAVFDWRQFLEENKADFAKNTDTDSNEEEDVDIFQIDEIKER